MTTKKTADESLLDAQLDFIMNAPDDQFDELLLQTGTNKAEMTRQATAAFDRAIDNHANTKRAVETLASLTPGQQASVCQNLKIRRSVFSALREHRAVVSSIPKRFLRRLAHELGQSMQTMADALHFPPPARLLSEHKSDTKPVAQPSRVTFEQLLHDAAMSEEDIQELMRDDD
jgi:hypothetical protein